MNIQSISICVPAQHCINRCEFCVSRMHPSEYQDNISKISEIYRRDYIKRLEYARDNGCNTVMLTGQVEPQQNRIFLAKFSKMNSELRSPFKNIEIQTTGALLNDEYLRFLRNDVGVTTISLSVSSLVSDDINNKIIHTPEKGYVHLVPLCSIIKDHGFNLRLSLNVTSALMDRKYPSIESIFEKCKKLGADQVTFRKMFVSGNETEQDKWIGEHEIKGKFFEDLEEYIRTSGNYIDTLEYGNERYSVNGMSVVIDGDCMAKDRKKSALKYVILRPDCKLYSKWDDKGSLIF